MTESWTPAADEDTEFTPQVRNLPLAALASTGAADGDALVYDEDSGSWRPGTVSGGGEVTEAELTAAVAPKADTTTVDAALAAKAPLASPAFTGTPTGITASHVGLGSVNNTADSAKPVSTAQQTALDLKADASTTTSALALKAPLASPTFTGTVAGVTKTHVGLGNVDNTADTAKPVSTAQAAADAAVAAAAADDLADLPDLTEGAGIDLDAGTPGLLSIATLASNIQTFTTAGTHTWTKPAGCTLLLVELISGGGGGGSGRKGAEGTDRFGGQGGCGGSTIVGIIAASAAGSTETVTVGAGGAGGASRTADSTDGAFGGVGTRSSFGTLAATNVSGAPLGFGGTAVASTAASFIGSSFMAGPGGGSFSNSGLATGTGGSGHTGGGGGGAWRNAANTSTPFGGGSGGQNPAVDGGAAGVAGTAGTGAVGGAGGGGGGVGVAGGAGGARGGGGGGGGAGINGSPGTPSGAGGAGGVGFVRITAIR